MKLGLCLFFIALVGMLFGSGALSTAAAAATCNGSIAQCYDQEEFLMESEISRKFLAGHNKYISTAALIRNLAAAAKPRTGKSYTRPCIYGKDKPC
ncbi:hypothetical protein MRB53_005539 [Persea americana]|uniref:Uncharacterized protein n=1 Tax=Persea americana TaxID=3435 RepID=A0ACC2MEI6_PERAE|nr:hypothetical protein MRB53_005539 [Persea americana]